ncbi:MAG: hypothetical protein QOG21_1281 [Actinomycetota bacterium]|nr:hypothetical protein [Actinomycetota bacterium]
MLRQKGIENQRGPSHEHQEPNRRSARPSVPTAQETILRVFDLGLVKPPL